MKSSILILLVILNSFFSSAMETWSDKRSAKPQPIWSLVVNANVTVVLVTQPGQEIKMHGDAALMRDISISENNGRLVIDGNKGRNYKNRGVIYIPAGNLTMISINGAAIVKSVGTLQSERLKILVNGNCKVHIQTIGKIDFVENEFFEVEYEVREKNNAKRAVAFTRE